MTSRKPRPAPNRNGRGFASSCTSLPSAPTPAVTRRTHRGRHAPPRSTARVGCRSSGARKGSRFRPLPQGTGGRKRALLGVSPRRTPLCSSGNRRLVSREMGGGDGSTFLTVRAGWRRRRASGPGVGRCGTSPARGDGSRGAAAAGRTAPRLLRLSSVSRCCSRHHGSTPGPRAGPGRQLGLRASQHGAKGPTQ